MIKLIEGTHLTAREKQVINYMIENNSESAHSKLIQARLIEKLDDGIYSVELSKNESDSLGRVFVRKTKVKIKRG